MVSKKQLIQLVSKVLRISRSRLGWPIWMLLTQHVTYKSPRTLNEKIRYKMRFDRSPLLGETAHTVGLRRYVERNGLSTRLPTAYLVWGDVQQVDVSRVPDNSVIKPSHASGPVLVVTSHAPRREALVGLRRSGSQPLLHDWRRSKAVVHPADLSQDALSDLVGRWLRWDYFRHRGGTEFCYREAPRAVIVEELLWTDSAIADDVKVWCSDGEARFLQVDSARFGDHRQSLFTPDGQSLAVSLGIAKAHEDPPPIPLREAVIEAASNLSGPFDFVRVDLYVVGDNVYLGELTHYPNGGATPFGSSETIDRLFAEWKPNLRY